MPNPTDILQALSALAKLGQNRATAPQQQAPQGPLATAELQQRVPASVPIPAPAPVSTSAAAQSFVTALSSVEADKRREVRQRLEREAFLQNVALAESGDREDVQHIPLKGTRTRGQYAVGRYGLTPNTVLEMIQQMRQDVKRNPELAEKYEREYGVSGLKGVTILDTPSKTKPDENYLQFWRRANQAQLNSMSPAQRDGVARYFADFVLRRAGGDPDKAYFFWNSGHRRQAPQDWLLYNHPQVKRFIELRGEKAPQVEADPYQRQVIDKFDEKKIYKGPRAKRIL